ncbi:hypothetical protein KI387_042251, partial [Taxus chinensis]
VHYSFLNLVNDLKLRQLLNADHLIDRGTKVTAKEAMDYWQQVLIDGVQRP